jgi:coenzyme F420-0:L-glutamate ligase/coenzyme F420-1:gamma-L-glutamate ligase
VLAVHPVPGLPEITPSVDLASAIVDACAAAGVPPGPGDVICVSSKIISKWRGLTAPDREAAVAADTRGVLARRRTPRGVTAVVRSAAGPVLAGAGVDESNTGPTGSPLRLPAEPDEEARRLRRELALRTGSPTPAVVLTDTAGRPWRDGQVDFALGVAGLIPVDDARGTRDAEGRMLEVTVRALADQVAAAADLVKGKVDRIPVAVVRGLGAWVTESDGPGAARLLRDPADDWFRLGDVEAVHAALGVPPGTLGALAAGVDGPPVPPVPPVPPGRLPGDPADCLRRAVTVALAVGDPPPVEVWLEPGPVVVVSGADPVAVGRVMERVRIAAAAERLVLRSEPVAWVPPADGPVHRRLRVAGA